MKHRTASVYPASGLRRWRRTALRLSRRIAVASLLGSAMAAVPILSAYAGSLSIPIIRDNVTNGISQTTSPVVSPVNKVIAPAADITPRIGETTAPVNDSAMFRANTALKNQLSSDSSGYISNN